MIMIRSKNFTIVTAGNKRCHLAMNDSDKALCGHKVVAIEEDQSLVRVGRNDYNDDLEDLQHTIQCARCFVYVSREAKDLVNNRNMENYKIRRANGTIVPR